VTEDGSAAIIAALRAPVGAAADLTLAIDTSGSVRKDLTEEGMRRGDSLCILRPQDQMSLMQFATKWRELHPSPTRCPDRSRLNTHADYALRSTTPCFGSQQTRPRDDAVADLVRTATHRQEKHYDRRSKRPAPRGNDLLHHRCALEAAPAATWAGAALITLADETGGKALLAEGASTRPSPGGATTCARNTDWLLPHNQSRRPFHRIDVLFPGPQRRLQYPPQAGYYGDGPATKN